MKEQVNYISKGHARDLCVNAQIDLMKASQLLADVRHQLQLNADKVPGELIVKISEAELLITRTNYNAIDDIQDFLIYGSKTRKKKL